MIGGRSTIRMLPKKNKTKFRIKTMKSNYNKVKNLIKKMDTNIYFMAK
jgi:hypothetical protein